MDQYKTPGVYIVEKNAFPNSVVEEPTAVPVFIGYTQKAMSGKTDLTNVPTKITSFSDFEQLFGAAPKLVADRETTSGQVTLTHPFLMHRGLRFFYNNGGADCYIVSVGSYENDDGEPVVPSKDALVSALLELEATPEPTMVLTPDSALMPLEDWAFVTQEVLRHCEKMQNRIAILDLVKGDLKFGQPAGLDPVSDFYNNVGTNGLNYGTAYYPWLNTNVVDIDEISVLNLSEAIKTSLIKDLEADDPALKDLAAQIATTETLRDAKVLHRALMNTSQTYIATMADVLEAINVMPPSTAMAGIITYTDNTIGPWNAPANTSVTNAISPTVHINSQEQENLNVPLNGLAINAIRTFINRGVLVWGARTLDGNSQDWRYISVRRTMIMIEQSAKAACQAYVFQANDANTWAAVKAMLENFLTNIWKQGALAGAKPEDAFSVDVGLGSTMTSTDILDGYMNVEVKVAVTHPAEFIVLTFQQQMQKS